MTVISTSPREALINSPNLLQTPLSRDRRLFSAKVRSRFLTVSPPAPACFSSSATIWLLSAEVRVGAPRIVTSLGSLVNRPLSLLSAAPVGSREEVLTAAVYYLGVKMTQRVSPSFCFHLGSRRFEREPNELAEEIRCRSRAIFSSEGIGAVTYQGSGISAIEAEEGDGRFDGLVGGSVGANLRGEGPRGSCSPGGAEQCLSRQHGGCGKNGEWRSSRFQLISLDRMSRPGGALENGNLRNGTLGRLCKRSPRYRM